MHYDIAIIGAGVVGAAIARRLSKYDISVVLIEKEDDVSCGASKANSGIVHGGYDAVPGTLKAKLNVMGARMYSTLNDELNFGYRQCGSLVLAFTNEDIAHLQALMAQGKENGVIGLRMLSQSELRVMEPNISPDALAALLCVEAGVVSPYEFTIALVENAVANGVELLLNASVQSIEKQADGGFHIQTSLRNVSSDRVINAAGLFSDQIAKMIGLHTFEIIPRKGQYLLYDKSQGDLVSHVLFQPPTDQGKGVLVTRTYHGNLMIGPDAQKIEDRYDTSTDEDSLRHILQQARKTLPAFDNTHVLTSFSGIRASIANRDFVVEHSDVAGFYNAVGIDSPGLSAAPAIAIYMEELLVGSGLHLEVKENWNPLRKAIIVPKTPGFAGDINSPEPALRVICRCEQVTEAEIVDAIHRGLPVTSTDAIKRRTRAGMGKCQGAFCGPRVKRIIARETGISEDAITTRTEKSSTMAERLKKQALQSLEEGAASSTE